MSVLMAEIIATGKHFVMGVRVYNPLPARSFVDLDKECIIPIGGEIDPFDKETLEKDIDDIRCSGTLPNGIAWGITSRSEYDFADILIDAEEVTEETIRQLIEAGVINTHCTCTYDPDNGKLLSICQHCSEINS